MRVSEVDSTPKVTPVSPRRAPARILGIECGAGSIGPISLRLMRLGFDMHHASSVDEARLLIAEDGIRIDVVVVSPESDLAGVAEIVELLTKANPDITPSLIVLGDEPKPARRESIRQAGARWILCHPFEDGDLRFLMNAAVSRPEEISNRKVPRAPVNAMAWIRAGSRRESGVISTLSENGAFIETSATIDQGTNIRLEFALPTGRVRAYAEVLYCVEEGDGIRSQASAGIGIRFFDLERGTVYAIREAVHYYSQRYLP